jgi:hypothetical protein
MLTMKLVLLGVLKFALVLSAKGYAAVATQAYTTAKNLGVLPALQKHMSEYFPKNYAYHRE